MKKIIPFIFSLFLFFGCDSFIQHDFLIQNNSNMTVSFSLKNYGDNQYTLTPGEEVNLFLYDNPQLIFIDNPRVSFISGVDSGIINNLDKKTVSVYNPLDVPVVLADKNNMLGDNYGDTYELPPNSITSINIYSSSLNLAATYKNNGKTFNVIDKLEFTPAIF
jgi:hypothetical protein